MTNSIRYTRLIKEEALRLGFSFCGISQACFLEDEAPLLERWLHQGMHGKMHYMAENFDKRLDPRKLVEGARSVISLLINYYPAESQNPDSTYQVSKYAFGRDYHKVLKSKLKALQHFIQTHIGAVNGRAFVDSAPVLDKAWAKRSGLGWMGKHSNIINKAHGSFYFIAELIIDLDLEYDGPVTDHCGTCSRCIDACPTDAIVAPYVVDGSRCISYFTIEQKDDIPTEYSSKFKDWIFGCDICQDVCPWNRFSKPGTEAGFKPLPGLLAMKANEWEEITEDIFEKVFLGSPLRRTKFEGLKRNIKAVMASKDKPA